MKTLYLEKPPRPMCNKQLMLGKEQENIVLRKAVQDPRPKTQDFIHSASGDSLSRTLSLLWLSSGKFRKVGSRCETQHK